MQRIAQPNVDRFSRSREHRDGWAGLVLALIGLALLVFGMCHLTGVNTVGGAGATEVELVKAFSSGGLRCSNPAALPGPSVLNDPTQAAAAFEKLQSRDRNLDKLAYRVDTAAAIPCPT